MKIKQIEADNPFLKLIESSYSGLLMFDAGWQLIYYSHTSLNIAGLGTGLKQGTPIANLIY